MDPSCLPALAELGRAALPPLLRDSLDRWELLDEEQRERARGDLELMARLVRRR